MRFMALIVCIALLGSCAAPSMGPFLLDYDKLPGPPINTMQVVPGAAGHFGMDRSRGIVNVRLSRDNPSTTFWNDPDTEKDPWGTVTLVDVLKDGTVVIDFGGERLRARPGHAFPGTGLFIVEAVPAEGRVWIRSRWTHTILTSQP